MGQPVREFTFGGVSNASGTSSTFGALTYAYNSSGLVSAATYSDGVAVNGITSDLEGNQSNATYQGYHSSEPNPFSIRGENVGTLSHTMPAAFANGIRLPVGPTSGTPPAFYRGGDGLHPVSVVPYGSPGVLSAYNPLDGFELSTTGSYYENTSGTDYTNAFAYDSAGRLSSSHTQLCTSDNQSLGYTQSETASSYSYDAEDHVLSEFSGATSSIPVNSCTFGPPYGNNDTYSVTWGTNGHPVSVSHTTDNTYLQGVAVYQEFLHWDGDTLLFTSATAAGAADIIKIGGVAEIRTADGVMQVFDRDSAGDIWDTHNTLPQSTGWNDLYGRFGWYLGQSESRTKPWEYFRTET